MANLHLRFCRAILDLVKDYAELTRLKNKVVDGEVFADGELEEIDTLSKSLSGLMESIELLEQKLGYENVGFPFMEDANFNGFSITNGELVGDLDNAYLVAKPWFCDFVDEEKTSESDCFKFCIAAFIVCMTDMLEPTVFEEVKRRRVVTALSA